MPSKKQEIPEEERPDRIISSHEFLIEKASCEDKDFRVKSHIPGLDRICRGFEGGELYSISGLTKHGKTSFAQTLTWNFLREQRHSLWFTFEVHPSKFFLKYPEVPTIYMPRQLTAYSMDWVIERILASYRKYHTRIVFIDHLHYLFDMVSTGRNLSLQIGTVVRRLKKLAVDMDFIVFLLCHTTKADPEAEVGYAMIRDSSLISQESDCVMMVQRTREFCPTGANLWVEFHRRTGAMREKVQMFLKDGLMFEYSPREDGSSYD